ncbi:FecCD family ABC transporter permease [Promicromonospora sp. NFX87]|uniref:FecCD family ABC transporter permease n=1 Tax=Promicromonospora sp. NFX87 TaxID=3402691 RepID=UPI003AFA838D
MSRTQQEQRRRRAAGLALVVAALALAALLSVMVGSKQLLPAQILQALVAPTGSDVDRIVLELRLPRTLAAVVVGAALGVSGALIQAFTRNPLGDPGILGVNAGASLGVACGIALFGTSVPAQHLGFAFVGALVATVVVLFIGAAGRSADPVRLTLAGVAVAAVLSGITTAITLLDPVTFNQMRGWAAGTFVERDLDVVLPAVPVVGAGLLIALVCARSLNALGLGDDLASALGTHVGLTRALAVTAITLLAGAATAVAGPIGFVGLMVPHVARWLVGPDQRWILPYSAVLAPVVLLVSDVVGRVVLWPGEVPVGIVTAFVGAPVLIWLVRRRTASAL